MDIKMVKVSRCPSQYSGSDTISGLDGCGSGASAMEHIENSVSSPSESSGKHRIRTIRLIRPSTKLSCTTTSNSTGSTNARQGPLGFSLRGGREHGTGFFISAVQIGSEAERQGLKIGDQIIRINGFTVEDAIHKEVLQLISNHKHINLKVRHVGMVPVKEKQSDSLGWQIIDDLNSIKRGSPTSRDIKINIVVTPRSKLDCGICKGPDWKPGIFIQFTKEGGIAHDVGLRPGDQILNCNNIDFSGISFNDAVHILKSSKQLELTVRQGVGLELIAAESSGYNSSASSVTGDQSPSSTDSKRLSIVKEETLELEDRLSQLDRAKTKMWNNDSGWNQNEPIRNCKPTIITLSGNETTIENNGPPEVCHGKFDSHGNVPSPPSQPVKHTVVAQIHRTEEDCNENKNLSKPIAPPLLTEKQSNIVKSNLANNEIEKPSGVIKNSPPMNGSSVIPPPPPPISLSNAICQELQKRSERKLHHQQNGTSEVRELRKIPPVDNSSINTKKQHDILMDEFRKVHHKMFASANSEANSSEEKKTESPSSTKPIEQTIPPPPPPLIKRSNTATTTHNKPKAPPVPKKTYNEIPPCPVPDYESNTMLYINNNSNTSSPQTNNEKSNKSHLDAVEMDSLESFQLNNPSGPEPKPPSTYFNKPRHKLLSAQSSVSSATSIDSMLRNGSNNSGPQMQQKKRPVSVTFSEYPSGVQRRAPARLGFLNGSKSCDMDDRGNNQSITSRLASELSQTLMRANLKNNDSQEIVNNLRNTNNNNNNNNNSVTINVNNSMMNGSPIPPAPNQIQMQHPHHPPLIKSQSMTTPSTISQTNNIHNNGLSNRLTIRISDENP